MKVNVHIACELDNCNYYLIREEKANAQEVDWNKNRNDIVYAHTQRNTQ